MDGDIQCPVSLQFLYFVSNICPEKSQLTNFWSQLGPASSKLQFFDAFHNFKVFLLSLMKLSSKPVPLKFKI